MGMRAFQDTRRSAADFVARAGEVVDRLNAGLVLVSLVSVAALLLAVVALVSVSGSTT